jgi:hypothetical protein
MSCLFCLVKLRKVKRFLLLTALLRCVRNIILNIMRLEPEGLAKETQTLRSSKIVREHSTQAVSTYRLACCPPHAQHVSHVLLPSKCICNSSNCVTQDLSRSTTSVLFCAALWPTSGNAAILNSEARVH